VPSTELLAHSSEFAKSSSWSSGRPLWWSRRSRGDVEQAAISHGVRNPRTIAAGTVRAIVNGTVAWQADRSSIFQDTDI
jgi:hypothetical protein